MAKTYKTGREAWLLMDKLTPMTVTADIGGGQSATIQPMTVYGSFVYITSDGYNAYYLQGDALKGEKPSVLFRNETIAIMARGALKAAWIVPVYKVMTKFMIAVVPGGRIVGAGVTAMSVAAFFSKHQGDLGQGVDKFKIVAACLQEIYTKSPRLGTVMLCVLIEESSGKISDEIKKKGLAKFVLENLDWQKFAEDAAELVGWMLRKALGGSAGGAVTGFFVKRGLLRLAKVVEVLFQVRTALQFVKKTANLKPGVKDKEKLAARLVVAFADAGVRVSQAEARAIADEDYLARPECDETLKKMKKAADELAVLVDKLKAAADQEIF